MYIGFSDLVNSQEQKVSCSNMQQIETDNINTLDLVCFRDNYGEFDLHIEEYVRPKLD